MDITFGEFKWILYGVLLIAAVIIIFLKWRNS